MTEQKWAGIDDALSAIDGLGELAGHEVSIKALTAAGRPIADDITSRLQSHRFTGETAGDISIRESTEAAAQGETVVLIGAKSRAYILRFLEFGTFKQRATPVIRPAWDTARSTYPAKLLEEYRKAYRSVVAKYSRKAAA